MKRIALAFLLSVVSISSFAQQPTVQMQCRVLASGQNNFLQPNETYVNGMACSPVAPVAVAAPVPAIPPEPVAAASEHNEVVPASKVDARSEMSATLDSSEYMTPADIQSAAQKTNPKWVTITAGSSLGQEMVASMAGVNLSQEASVHLFTAESWTAFSAQQLRRQYKQFTPASLSKAETMRGLTVVGFGMAYGSSAGPQCASVTRIALISDKGGEVVVEAVDQDPVPSTWSNAFGASATCQALVARFAEKDVERVSEAAKDGEYFIGVFSGSDGRFLYKVKRKFLKQLAEE